MGTELGIQLQWADTPVPAARALDNFSATEVGNGEYVFLDNERLEYHTMNEAAFAVWQLCDGVRTSPQIAATLADNGSNLPVEAVELAVAELGEAGLLESTSGTWSARLTRRNVIKLASAGALGAAILPAVSSISSPTSANLTTCGANQSVSLGQECACSSECVGSCCCSPNSGIGNPQCSPRTGSSTNCNYAGGGNSSGTCPQP